MPETSGQTSELPSLTDQLVGLHSDRGDDKKLFLTGEQKVSWGDLRTNVGKTLGLFAQLDLTRGSRVVIASERDEVVSYLYGACLAGGFTAVVLDPNSSAAEITVIAAKARPDIVFADQALLDRSETLRSDDQVRTVAVAAVAPSAGFGLRLRKRSAPATNSYPGCLASFEPSTYRDPSIEESDAALILFTSGTTSQPKGVVLTRRNLSAQLSTFRNHYGYGMESRIANQLPLHHTDGLNQAILLALATGCTWIRPGAMDMQGLGDALDVVVRERATHLITVPTVIAMMTRLPDTYDDAFAGKDFRFISSTAGFLDPGIWDKVETRFHTMVTNSYGLTETVMEALYCGPTTETRRIGTIGKPVDCEAMIVTDEGTVVDAGEVGELWLRGDHIMAGYFENPEATAATLKDGWLLTGDLAVQDSDGFFAIAGRKKNVIIRAGINVYPADVDAVLLGCAGVADSNTIGIEDTFLGEKVISCVVAVRADEPLSGEALMAQCRAELASEKIPNQIVVLDRLPYGPSGKVEHAKVEQMVLSRLGADGGVESVDSRSKVFALAAAAFRDPVDSLSESSTPDTTPGWDSLSFLEFILSLERIFDMTVEPRAVMNLRSLADALELVENR